MRVIAATTGVSLGKVSSTLTTLDALDLVRPRARTLPDALVSGEYAAAALTRHLEPSSLTLHLAPTETKRAAVELRLYPSDAGAPDVIIIDRFLPPLDRADEAFVTPSSAPSAHPILARAELLALGSDRLREVADRLRDHLILPRLVGGA